jgi:hypothetical protein
MSELSFEEIINTLKLGGVLRFKNKNNRNPFRTLTSSVGTGVHVSGPNYAKVIRLHRHDLEGIVKLPGDGVKIVEWRWKQFKDIDTKMPDELNLNWREQYLHGSWNLNIPDEDK